MKLIYEQTYVPGVDITIIMKAVEDSEKEIIDYRLTGYYHGKPCKDGLELFKDSLKDNKEGDK